MDEHQRAKIFDAQTINVRELEKAWIHTNRQINALILQKNLKAIEVNTKLLALIYCALAEAIFSKLIHTPHGLSLDNLEQVKILTNANGVKSGWLKCSELAMLRVQGAKSSHCQNVLKKLSTMIEAYIFDPSILRNKLAHGQWSIALNRQNTAVNQEITSEIEAHTVVELYRRKHALEKLAAIIEDIIESPNKAHHRDYWSHITDFEQSQMKLSSWTYEAKVQQLFAKKARAPDRN